MLAEFTAWLIGVLKEFFSSLWSFVTDAAIAIVELIVSAFVALVALIPIPSFMSGGLQSVYSMLDPGIAYVLSSVGLPQALGILGAGYLFRLARKAATLFQW